MSGILSPLDFFRDDDGFVKPFSGRKKLVSLKPPKLTPIPPPPPPGETSMVAAPWEKGAGGGWVIRVETYWRTVDGIARTCNDVAVTIATSVTIGLTQTISQSTQATVEAALGVEGVGKIGSKLTATTGYSFSTSTQTTSSLQFIAKPPASGTIQYEVKQPVLAIIFLNIDSGSKITLENALLWKDVETKAKPEPECKKEDDKVGMVDPFEKEEYAYLEDIPKITSKEIDRLKLINIKSLEELAASTPGKITSAGINVEEATKLIDEALVKLDKNVEVRDAFFKRKSERVLGV